MADAITDAMIEAGAQEFGIRHSNCCYPQAMDFEANLAAEAIYLAMETARQPQLPSDDGLNDTIELLQNASEALAPLSGQWVADLRARLNAHCEALSRHKAPLSVAGDDVERFKVAIEQALIGGFTPDLEQVVIDTWPAVWIALTARQPVAGDDVGREARQVLTWVQVQRRLKHTRSIPLNAMENLALTALQVTEGDKVERSAVKAILENNGHTFARHLVKQIEALPAAALQSKQEGEG